MGVCVQHPSLNLRVGPFTSHQSRVRQQREQTWRTLGETSALDNAQWMCLWPKGLSHL